MTNSKFYYTVTILFAAFVTFAAVAWALSATRDADRLRVQLHNLQDSHVELQKSYTQLDELYSAQADEVQELRQDVKKPREGFYLGMYFVCRIMSKQTVEVCTAAINQMVDSNAYSAVPYITKEYTPDFGVTTQEN